MSDYSREMYRKLFNSEESKAAAFDKIAEHYFHQNFGTIQKADLDVLLFSIYIERILDNSEEDISSYSDYNLSKLLGVTQTRIASLKEKKELKYPYNGFNVRRSFERVLQNATYEGGKIRVYIPDRNLFLELKHIIEENGGIVDVQLNSSLLQVTPDAFISLMIALSADEEKDSIAKKLKSTLNETAKRSSEITSYLESKTLGENIKLLFKEQGLDLVASLLVDMSGFSSIEKLVAIAKKLFSH